MSAKYCIGVDFGTLSARALLVDVADGRELATATMDYPHAVMDERLPDGTRLHKMALSANPTTPRKELGGRCYFDYTNGRFAWKEFLQASGSRLLEGWQLRYIYFIDPECRKRLTVPEIPFSKIDEIGAGMYKGEKVTQAARHAITTPE